MARNYKLLEVENLNTSFKIDAGKVLSVNGVSFTLEKGKILGIVGESGSGKSVNAYYIMLILDKNVSIDNGKIIYNGTDLTKLSEKEMRDIRGNKISIIFQDAMTSLNPTWSIGNQLREAILTHSKHHVKQAIADIENAIRSDEQRIEAMKRGYANHPDRTYILDDLKEIEEKLIADKKFLEVKKVEAVKSYNDLKAAKNAEYKNGRKAFDLEIRKAFVSHFKNYFRLNKNPDEDYLKNSKDAKALLEVINLKKANYEKQNQKVNDFINNFEKDYASLDEKEKKEVYRQTLKNERSILKTTKKEFLEAVKAYKKHLNSAKRAIRYAPRKERRNALIQALKNKYAFRMECISAYKETRYSANKKAIQMLMEVGITDPKRRMKQHPFEMSGGMLQRAMIAMALVQRPDILIADEPTTALDVTIQAQILELLKKLQKEYGMAIIIITHDLGVVAQMCDEVDIMYAGRIVERGTVDEIFYNPQHEYTKGLINSMPKIDSDGKRLEPIQGNPVDLFCLPKGCAFSSRCKECMEICIEKYPEEVKFTEEGHAASCWKMIKTLHEKGEIDIVNGLPEGKPLIYNGALIVNERKTRKEKGLNGKENQ